MQRLSILHEYIEENARLADDHELLFPLRVTLGKLYLWVPTFLAVEFNFSFIVALFCYLYQVLLTRTSQFNERINEKLI
jgi:hypothetical protein